MGARHAEKMHYAEVLSVEDLERVAERGRARRSDDEIDVTAAKLVRAILTPSRRVIGLLPAGKTSDSLSLAEAFARAIYAATETMVIVIDPEQRTMDAGAKGTRGFIGTAISQGVAAISPHETCVPGAKSVGIKALLDFVESKPNAWRAALVDLSGCALPGELLDVMHLMHGIVIVGHAGRATEAELRKSSARIPEELNLGIVLTDSE